jgi:hypothetical protein
LERKIQMDLFDRYVYQVGRRLPKRSREDVEAELRSLLQDALEDRVGEGAGDDDELREAVQAAVLEELGPPAKMAAQYRPPHRHLIGPPLFDIYVIVVAVVAGSLTLVHGMLLALIVWGESLTFSGLASSLGGVLESYLGAMLSGFGSVTLTFAILERVLPESALQGEEEKEEWDPHTLPEISDRERVEVGGLVVEIVFTVIGLVVFNVFPGRLGIGFVRSLDGADGAWQFFPVLTEAFFTSYLPWLNVLWVAALGLKVVLLRQGRWQRLTRLLDVVLAVGNAFVLRQMVFGPSILSLDAIEPESLREVLSSFLPALLKVGLVVGLLATIAEVIHKIYLLWRTTGVPFAFTFHLKREQ